MKVAALACALVATAGLGAADALIEAAETALARGDGVRALALIEAHPAGDVPELVLLRARALLLQGRYERVVALLEAPVGERWEGLRQQLRGEALLATRADPAAAMAALGRAIEAGGEGVALDRCLLLLAAVAREEGRDALAKQAAERVWIGWRRSESGARAGLLLAELVSAEDPDRARRLLTALRYQAREPELRVAAEEHLCRLLLVRRPAECLALARSAFRRSGDDRFREWELRALAELDPAAARDLLAELEAAAPDEGFDRLRAHLAQPVAVADADPIDAALRAWEAGHRDEAEARLAALAADPVARAILVWKTGRDSAAAPRPTHPVAIAAAAAAMLPEAPGAARELLARSDPPAVEDPVRRALERRLPGLLALQAQAVVASDPRDPALAAWRALLRESTQPDAIRGTAWCWEAQAVERAGTDAGPAWIAAATALPVEHPWAAIAAQRGARTLLLDLPPGAAGEALDAATRARLSEAARLLSPAAWAGDEPEHLACRWLLAQALAQAGAHHEARRCAESLLPAADATRSAMVGRFLARLTAARHTVSTQVFP